MKVKHDKLKLMLSDKLKKLTDYNVNTEVRINIAGNDYPDYLGSTPPLPSGTIRDTRDVDVLVDVPKCHIGYGIEVKTSWSDARDNLIGQLFDIGRSSNIPILATTQEIANKDYTQDSLNKYNSKLILYTGKDFQGITDIFETTP